MSDDLEFTVINDIPEYIFYIGDDEENERVIALSGKDGAFKYEKVIELPTTGEEGKLYLTPKAHTTQTATGNPVTASVTEQAGKLESFQLDGDTMQNGTPSPEYPQSIQTVTGEQTVSVIGKNLFNKNAVTNSGYIDTNGEVVAWETFGYSEYIRVIGGQTYSYSGTANNVGYSAKAAWYDSNKNFISAFSFGTSGQVTAPATAKFLRTSVRIASPSGLDTYQLELGSTITTYEAYRATNYPINLGSIELCKLGTYQDYIWKDGDDWKVHKATSKATIDSLTDGESSSIDTALTNTTRVKIDKCLGEQASYAGRETPVCNEFGYKLIWNSDEAGFYLDIGSDQSKNGIIFRGSKNVIGTTSTAIESWLNSKPITVYYAIATATDTTITDTTLIAQLEIIRNAQLATGTSTITNNATGSNLVGDMEIGYYGYNTTNRFDKWIWLDFDNSYEQLNNPESTATLSPTRSLSTTTEQITPTRSVETVTLKKGASDTVSEKTELDPVEEQEEIEEKAGVPVERDIEETRPTEADEEPKEKNSEQAETEKEEEPEER